MIDAPGAEVRRLARFNAANVVREPEGTGQRVLAVDQSSQLSKQRPCFVTMEVFGSTMLPRPRMWSVHGFQVVLQFMGVGRHSRRCFGEIA